MATSYERNKNIQRPKKSDAEKRRRTKVQQRRLVALGVPEEKVKKLNSQELRSMLLRPAKIAKKA